MIKYFTTISVLILGFFSCIEIERPYSQLPPGIWRAELHLEEDVTLPFNLESSYNEEGQLEVHVLNAEERIKIKDVSFGRSKDLRDTVVMAFPLFDSYITAEFKENVIEGRWHVNNRENYDIPFVAFHGQSHRFTTEKNAPYLDLSGKWQATFEVETEDVYPAIGEFVQKDNRVTGTFLTETGDYRYLEGTIQGNQLSLSCFDGSHAFLFTGNITKDETISGKFFSGSHYKTNWIASRNEQAVLTNAYELSQITTEDKKISFSLPNEKGEIISLSDEQYKGKAKLITIMGTWCPNCLDESKFLIDYVRKNPNQELEIIALSFEKYREKATASEKISTYKKRLNIPYEMLLAGYYDKAEATKDLGFIDEILSYPTLLFVNKENVVTKVHTGFSGPATSEYDDFVKEFAKSVAEIL